MALTRGRRASEQNAGEQQVRIDGQFVREHANTAVRQFFSPITAPFRFAAQAFPTQTEATKAAQDLAKRHRR